MKKWHTCASTVAVTVALAMAAGAASAQDVSAQPDAVAPPENTAVRDAGGIVEVTVTATRRASTIREVPFSIVAYSGEQMRAQQIFNPAALVQQVPGLTLNTADKSLSIIAIRGNVSSFRTATLDTPVAFFVDDVYYVFNNDLNANFYDTTRVEVLRGPQGTLFGRNVVGGAIAVITNNPEFGTDYYAQVTGGNGGYLRTEGMLNGTLMEGKVAGRLSFSTEHSDGLIDTPNQKGNFGELDTHSARGKLLFTPTDNLKVVLSADTSTASGNGGAVGLRLGGPQVVPDNFGPFVNDKWTNNDFAPAPYQQKLRGAYIRADLDLAGGVLTSITGYRLNDSYSYLDNIPVAAPTSVFGLEQTVRNRSFTQEVRYASAPGRLTYVVGAFYLHANVTTDNNFYYSPLDGSPIAAGVTPNPGVTNISRTQKGVITSTAAFGEATFNFTEQWSLVAGGRYTRDQKKIDYRAFSTTDLGAIPIFAFPGTVVASGGQSWGAFTPRVSVKFRPNDKINFYATYAKGFKSGGFVDNAYSDPTLPLDPEDAVNTEIGMKSRLFNNRVTFNISAFNQKTENLQNFSGTGGTAHTYNGTAVSKGVELESVWSVTDALRLNFNYAHIDGTYTSLKDPLVLADFSGNPVKFTPKDAFTLGANYVHQVANGGMVTVQSDYSYSSQVSTDDANGLKNYPNLYEQTKGSTLNARLTYDSQDGRWSIGVWGKNLTDHYQIVTGDDNTVFLGSPASPTHFWKVFTNTPRTFGITLSIKQ